MRQPNVLFVFADQLRAQATGFGGDPNARTPTLDALAASSVVRSTPHPCPPHPTACQQASPLTRAAPRS